MTEVAAVVLDGSKGEGGGQILRTALALSIVTGIPFRVDRIRAGRNKPGLLRQHLTAVRAAATLASAGVDGAELGSERLSFTPAAAIRGGEHRFSVGSAGSATLVLQTLLLPLLCGRERAVIEIEGGTHNPAAPPYPFVAEAFLPVVASMGGGVTAELVRPGFYPAGGGLLRVVTRPSQLAALGLETRGDLLGIDAVALVAGLDPAIGAREVDAVLARLPGARGKVDVLASAHGPGNAVVVTVRCENVTEVFVGFGQRGVRAEDVAARAAEEAAAWLSRDVPVGEYLADQLIVPMVCGEGGTFVTEPPSLHLLTQKDVVAAFVGDAVRIEPERDRPSRFRVTVRGLSQGR